MTLKRMRPAALLAGLLVLAVLMTGCFGGLSGVAPRAGGGTRVVAGETPNFPAPGMKDSDLAAHVPGQIIVGVDSEERAFEVAQALNASVKRYLEPIGAALLELHDKNVSLTDAMRSLEGRDGVRYAQPNFTDYYLPYVKERGKGDLFGAAGAAGASLLQDEEDAGPPTWYERFQYGPRITRAVEAWDKGITGKDRVIAVIDTGVRADHPDLYGKVLEGYNPDWGTSDRAATDDFHGHGTHVAATAAGWMNVAAGERMTVGIAPEAYILPLRVFNPAQGGGYTSTSAGIAEAILVAADPGLVGLESPPADVANMSLGGRVYSQAIQDAVNWATDQGTVVVVSMGNSEHRQIAYPAAYQRTIPVAATNARDEVTSFSTRGSHASVGAPGEFVFAASVDPDTGGNVWAWMSGTSMAAPHVSGAVALLRQYDPSLTPAEIKALLEQTADPLPNFGPEDVGRGRINVARALNEELEPTNYGMLEVFVHDGFGPTYQANVVLMKGDKIVGTKRTGGFWYIDGEVYADGIAWFFELEPGSDYSVYVTYDNEALHPTEALAEKHGIEVRPNEMTQVVMFVR